MAGAANGVVPPGDTLNVDISADTVTNLEITPSHAGGFGNLVVTAGQPLSFNGVETFDVTAGGPIHLKCRNDLSTNANTSAGNGSEHRTVRHRERRAIGSGPQLQISAEEPANALVSQFNVPQADILSFTLTGSARPIISLHRDGLRFAQLHWPGSDGPQ